MPIYSFTILQRWNSQEIRNVYYYETTNQLDSPQKQEAVDAFKTAYDNLQLTTDLDETWSARGALVRQVDVADLPSIEFSFSGGDVVGENISGKSLPTQVAILLRGVGDTPFPRNTRIYHGGLNDLHLTNTGVFTLATQNSFDTFIIELDQIVVTGDTLNRVAVHWDRVNNVVDDWNTVNTYDVTGNPVIQRRRRQGSGI